MKSILSLIKHLKEKDWNYYSEFENNIPIEKPFVSNKSPKNFIQDYFKKGGKEDIAIEFFANSYNLARSEHTISLFFIGCLLFKKTRFQRGIFFNLPVNENYEFFPFIWFLTCLAHDTAFDLERNQELHAKVPTLDLLKHHLDIEFDLFDQDVNNSSEIMFGCAPNYYKYRHMNGAVDHGIYAGLFLYDRLVKNRLSKKERGEQNLFWGDQLDAEYAYAAATIATHNIWLPNKADVGAYNRHGLTQLVDKKPITFTESPLLYFLGIIDSIEPVKAYSCLNANAVLQKVGLSFPNDQTIVIKPNRDLKLVIIAKKAKELETWLDLEVNVQNDRVEINLNFN